MAEIITLDDSPRQAELNPPKRKAQGPKDADASKMSKAKCGEDVAISPAVIAKVRKLERSTSSNVIGSFYALTASAQNLLPGKAVSLSKEKLKNMVAKPDEGEEMSKDPESAKKQAERSKKKEGDLDRDEKNKEEFYCELCDAYANSELSYETHIQGKKHQKKLATFLGERAKTFGEDSISLQSRLDQGPLFKRKEKFGTMPKLKTKLDDVDAPVIGLNYVAEIWRLDPTIELMYYCELCQSTCQSITIIDHIVGYRHRLSYIKENYQTLHEKVKNMSVKKSELSKILEEYAHGIEKREGRGKIRVEEEIEGRFSPEPYQRNRYQRDEPFGNVSHHSRDTKHHESTAGYPNCYPRQMFERVDLYPSSTRMEMLKELVDIDPQELRYSMDASRLETVIRNFKEAILNFQNKQGFSGGVPIWNANSSSSLSRRNDQYGMTDHLSAFFNGHNEGNDSYRNARDSRRRSESDRSPRDNYQSSRRSGLYSANF